MLIILAIFILAIAFLIAFNLITKKKKNLTSDSTVLITGGCMGIGRGLALQFASKHHCTVIIYDVRADLGNELIKEIESVGGKGYFYECDISNKQALIKVFGDTIQKFPRIDILINNAGVTLNKKFEDHTDDEFEHVMGVNVWGPYHLTRHVLPVMRKQNSGHIVTVASMVSHVYSLDSSFYTASKGAVFNMFSSFRLELKRENSPIKTTIICPWVVDTGMFEGFKVSFSFFGLLGFLKTADVVDKAYKAIMCENEELYLPFYHQIAFRLMLMIPSYLSDLGAIWLGRDSMKNLIGRHKKKD